MAIGSIIKSGFESGIVIAYFGGKAILKPLFTTTTGKLIILGTTTLCASYVYLNLGKVDPTGKTEEEIEEEKRKNAVKEFFGKVIFLTPIVAGITLFVLPRIVKQTKVGQSLSNLLGQGLSMLYSQALIPGLAFGVQSAIDWKNNNFSYGVKILGSTIYTPLPIVMIDWAIWGVATKYVVPKVKDYVEDIDRHHSLYGYGDSTQPSALDQLSWVEKVFLDQTLLFNLEGFFNFAIFPLLSMLNANMANSAKKIIIDNEILKVKFTKFVSWYPTILTHSTPLLGKIADLMMSKMNIGWGGTMWHLLGYTNTATSAISIALNTSSIIAATVSVMRVRSSGFTLRNQPYREALKLSKEAVKLYQDNTNRIKQCTIKDSEAIDTSRRLLANEKITKVLEEFAKFKTEKKDIAHTIALAIKILTTDVIQFDPRDTDESKNTKLEVLRMLILTTQLTKNEFKEHILSYHEGSDDLPINNQAPDNLPKRVANLDAVLKSLINTDKDETITQTDNLKITDKELAYFSKIIHHQDDDWDINLDEELNPLEITTTQRQEILKLLSKTNYLSKEEGGVMGMLNLR